MDGFNTASGRCYCNVKSNPNACIRNSVSIPQAISTIAMKQYNYLPIKAFGSQYHKQYVLLQFTRCMDNDTDGCIVMAQYRKR